MKPKRFTRGQKITPKDNSVWEGETREDQKNSPVQMPKFGQIYTVAMYDLPIKGRHFLYLFELDAFVSWEEDGFDPLVEDKVLEKELSEIEIPVEI